MQPCNRYSVRSPNVLHIGILAAAADAAAGIVVLEHAESYFTVGSSKQQFPQVKCRKTDALKTVVCGNELALS